MRKIIDLSVDELTPSRTEILVAQGMANRPSLPPKIESLLVKALEIFRQLAEPKGLLEEMNVPDFDCIYEGDGTEGPVPLIAPRADAMAMFAATLGSSLVERSSRLFVEGGPALGFMLDAVNTSAAERLGRLMCRSFLELLPEEKRLSKNLRVQYYCPGHCGWNIAGQTRFFERLKPEEIGVSVNSRWVMQPVKSLSGLLIAGDIEIHRFQPGFSFCTKCREHKCVSRLRLLESEHWSDVNPADHADRTNSKSV